MVKISILRLITGLAVMTAQPKRLNGGKYNHFINVRPNKMPLKTLVPRSIANNCLVIQNVFTGNSSA